MSEIRTILDIQGMGMRGLRLDGSDTPGFGTILRRLGRAMAAHRFRGVVAGQRVVVAFRAEDADDFGRGVLEKLEDRGARVAMACHWARREFQLPDDERAQYIVRNQYVEEIPSDVNRMIVAVPFLNDAGLVLSMLEALKETFGPRPSRCEIVTLVAATTQMRELQERAAMDLEWPVAVEAQVVVRFKQHMERFVREDRVSTHVHRGTATMPDLIKSRYGRDFGPRRSP